MKIPARGEEKDGQGCASMAPFLTALFDGEADEDAARAARAHLLSCQKCARTWLSWNQHRAALRNQSVPAPPPNLLWRVLLACRLSATSRASASSAAAPADLEARILAQTTRSTSLSNARSKRVRFRLSWAPTLAAPALAAWLLLLNRGLVPSPSPSSPQTQTRNNARTSVPRTPREARIASRSFVDKAAPRTVTKTTKASTKPARSDSLASIETRSEILRAALQPLERSVPSPVVVSEPPRAPSQPSAPAPLAFAKREVEPRRAAPIRLAIAARPPLDRSVVSRVAAPNFALISNAKSLSPASSSRDFAALGTNPTSVSTSAPRVQLAAISKSGASLDSARARVSAPDNSPRAASFSDVVEVPRVRLARPKLRFVVAPARARSAPVDEATLRVSQPRARGIQAVAFAQDEEVAEEQVDDLRGVVDEFRAALSEDSFE